MVYEDLPDDIRRILPKSKFGSARSVSHRRIVTKTNYDNDPDVWTYNNVSGRWERVERKERQ